MHIAAEDDDRVGGLYEQPGELTILAIVRQIPVAKGTAEEAGFSAEDWLPDSDELTPTMKLKRRPIAQKYASQIEGLYTAKETK